jgi:hypothetical protein
VPTLGDHEELDEKIDELQQLNTKDQTFLNILDVLQQKLSRIE